MGKNGYGDTYVITAILQLYLRPVFTSTKCPSPFPVGWLFVSVVCFTGERNAPALCLGSVAGARHTHPAPLGRSPPANTHNPQPRQGRGSGGHTLPHTQSSRLYAPRPRTAKATYLARGIGTSLPRHAATTPILKRRSAPRLGLRLKPRSPGIQ